MMEVANLKLEITEREKNIAAIQEHSIGQEKKLRKELAEQESTKNEELNALTHAKDQQIETLSQEKTHMTNSLQTYQDLFWRLAKELKTNIVKLSSNMDMINGQMQNLEERFRLLQDSQHRCSSLVRVNREDRKQTLTQLQEKMALSRTKVEKEENIKLEQENVELSEKLKLLKDVSKVHLFFNCINL